ncbi:unnamed protein product [Meloidogyne enterolobii]|uniref:Uncharacterized protein n=1 Tax=Meloidogyne enterolobii TaxID=390850 RepID=A0ACB1B5I5_MELEN
MFDKVVEEEDFQANMLEAALGQEAILYRCCAQELSKAGGCCCCCCLMNPIMFHESKR